MHRIYKHDKSLLPAKEKKTQVFHFLNYTLVESTVTCSSRRMVAKSFMLLEESFAGKKYISPSS